MALATIAGHRAANAVVTQPVNPDRVRAALREFETLEARDPTNPAIAFWRGRARRTLAKSPADHTAARADFLAALDRGRADADTLLLAARSTLAAGDAPGTLALLASWADRLPPDARLLDLQAEAARQAGDTGRADAATAAAAALRKSPASAPKPGGCR